MLQEEPSKTQADISARKTNGLFFLIQERGKIFTKSINKDQTRHNVSSAGPLTQYIHTLVLQEAEFVSVLPTSTLHCKIHQQTLTRLII